MTSSVAGKSARRTACVSGIVVFWFCAALTWTAPAAKVDLPFGPPIVKDADAIEQVDPYIGDYMGVFDQRNKTSWTLVAQVIALGDERYHANVLPEFDKRVEPIASLEGRIEDGRLRFIGWGDVSEYCGPDWEATIENGKMRGTVPSRHGGTFAMERVVRLSPTLGAKPPQGAVVLFDGSDFDKWERRGKTPEPVSWQIEDDAAITRGGTIRTSKQYDPYLVHFEFRVPFQPDRREQGRGNSGVYVHGREIQVLDSYGLKGRAKEGGGFYSRQAPIVNMCAPPMQWQTYDVICTQPEEGNGRLTVYQNGILTHDEFQLDRKLGPTEIQLQDHGNPVQYRNIWLVERM